MRIQYEISHADVDAWNRHSLTLPGVNRSFRRRALMMALTTGLVVGGLGYSGSRSLMSSSIAGGTLFLVVAVLGGSALRHEALKTARAALDADPTHPALGHHALEVTPDAVTESSPLHTLSVQWHSVAGVVQTGDHVFLILRSLGVIIVPVRCFASEQDRDSFVLLLRRFAPAA